MFAVGYKLFGSAEDKQSFDIRAVYWQQAVITTGTTALAGAARLDSLWGRGRRSLRG